MFLLPTSAANAFTSDSFELLASGCRQLASLTVGTCDDFTDSSLMAVCEFCPNLSALAILDAPSLTEVTPLLISAFDCTGGLLGEEKKKGGAWYRVSGCDWL